MKVTIAVMFTLLMSCEPYEARMEKRKLEKDVRIEELRRNGGEICFYECTSERGYYCRRYVTECYKSNVD